MTLESANYQTFKEGVYMTTQRDLGAIAKSPDGKFVAVWVEDDAGRYWSYVPIVWGIDAAYEWPSKDDADKWSHLRELVWDDPATR